MNGPTPRWHYSTKNGHLTVYEGSGSGTQLHAYWLYNHLLNKEVCLGDGVDWMFDGETALKAGEPALHAALEQDLERNERNYLYAYFSGK